MISAMDKRELYNDIKNQIHEKLYAEVPFSISQDELREVAEQFLTFTKLSEEEKQPFSKKVPNYKRGRVGYVQEERKEGATDSKEYFHYTLEFEDLYKQEIKNNKNKQIEEFLQTLTRIYKETETAMLNILEAFDVEFKGIYEKFVSETEHPVFTLRILKYTTTKQGDFLAKGHYDRGCCTLALGESAPGLRLGKTDRDLKEVSHTKGKAIFMPAISFPVITAKHFHPVWHDVVQKGEKKIDQQTARWAVVFFANTYSLNEEISYEKAHTPIEE